MVSTIANGNAMAITRIASTVTIVSRRSVKFLTLGNALASPSLAHAFPSFLPSGAGFLSERGLSAYFQGPLGIEEAVKLDEFGHESGPAGLVTGAQPGTIVAMEVFKEVDVVAPEWIALELFRAAIDGSPAMFVAQEDPGEPVRDLLADLEEVHELAGSRGTFDFEVVAVVQIEVQQRPDNERVHRHPDRSPPVGVAAEHASVRLRRQVVHSVFLPLHVEDVGVLLVELGKRADAIRAQELVFVEHLRKDPAEPLRVDQSHYPPLRHAEVSRARGMHGLQEFGYPA